MTDSLKDSNPEVIYVCKPTFYQNLKSLLTNRIILMILITLVLILTVAAVIFIYSIYFQTPSKPELTDTPQSTITPKQTRLTNGQIINNYQSDNFNSCIFKKDTDKLITLAKMQKDGTFFVGMAGNIMDMKTNLEQITMTLTAPDGSQTYQFTLPKNDRIVLADSQSKQTAAVSELKPFLSVAVFGICDPKAAGNKLTINQINILGDLTNK